MPQKRNPDAAELIRAKPGRVLGAFTALAVVMKGLPLTYSKDMQEDKEQVFDAIENMELALAAMSGMVRDMLPNRAQMKAAAATGFSTATDLADWLVQKLKMPFRDAHHISGRIVALAEKKNVLLSELSLGELQSVHGAINSSVFKVLSVEASVKSRTSFGGTAPANVSRQAKRWLKILKVKAK